MPTVEAEAATLSFDADDPAHDMPGGHALREPHHGVASSKEEGLSPVDGFPDNAMYDDGLVVGLEHGDVTHAKSLCFRRDDDHPVAVPN